MLRKALLAALVFQGVASAMCGNAWVAGEALLLRPSGAYPYVALIGPGPTAVPEGCQLASCPDYKWGYKIELGYRNCGKEALINWLSWNNCNRNKYAFTENEVVWNTIGVLGAFEVIDDTNGAITASSCVNYDALDAELATWMCKECSKWSARAFLGLRYARVRNERTINFIVGTDEPLPVVLDRIATSSDLQGTGPRFGFDAHWDVWCNIGLSGSIAGHVLIGSAKSQYVDFRPSQLDLGVPGLVVANVKNRKYCRMVPAGEVKFGLDWKGCLFCGFSGELGVGYQITHYFYGSQSTLFTQNLSATNHVHTDPISFDGWYFRIGLMY